MRTSTVKLVFFVLMQSLKTSPALLTIIITFSTCRGGLKSINKSCSTVFQLHMIPDYVKHCISSDPLTPSRGRLTGVKLGQEIHREYDFHTLHCVYRDRLLTFSHTLFWKHLGATRSPRYNGVAVYSESRTFRRFEPI